VTRLQEGLQQLGYYPNAAALDGIFGPHTEGVVKQFQIDNGLASG
jgi:peptidoglycan hydrolase-like protein with peptidoglycan-binding domain